MASVIVLVALVTFTLGLAVARYEIWPFRWIQLSLHAGESFIEFGDFVPEGRRVEPPAGAAREAFTVHDEASLHDGLFVLLGSDDASGRYAAWLYDQSGRRLHRWDIDYRRLDPAGPPQGLDMPHAFSVLEDGSAIVSFDGGNLMARIDTCGQPIWTKEGIFHHAMARADDGSYWVWRADGSHYAQYHYLTNFDPKTGKTLNSIGLVEDVIGKLGPHASMFSVRHDHPFQRISADPDIRSAVDYFHPNSVDVLSAEYAPAFPGLTAGDLLLSFREIDLVAVLDPRSHRLKWWQHGPWVKQHDPDFMADGRISVYSNYPDRGRSEILTIDPVTHRVENDLYQGNVAFYSATMGKHQYLPDGSVLITVPDEGRALLVTADGDMIAELNNVSSRSNKYNEHVEDAIWLPADYFRQPPSCASAP